MAGAKDAGGAAASVAGKLKTPAIAGGAALAGLAGGLALAARKDATKKVLGVPIPKNSRTKVATRNLSDAAKQVGSFGERVGELTTEIRRVREGVEDGGSPIDMLLQGLASRPKR